MANRNSTSFWKQLRELFETKRYDPSDVLKYSQFVVVEYVKAVARGEVVNGGRGLIINHGMGVGKSITAAAIGHELQALGFETIMIGPKALASNFETNVQKLSVLRDEKILPGGYRYFTLRAGNLPEQIVRAEVRGAPVGDLAEDDVGAVSLVAAFEGKVILIDEAHLFCNSVAHGRNVALRIYKALMNTKRCWVFLFSGTLVTNTPFESVPAYNLVAGRAVFSEEEEDFNSYFGSVELLEKNRGRLQNLMSGYLSYAVAGDDDGLWPKKLPSKIVRLPMEGAQGAAYEEARLVERREDIASAQRKKKRPSIVARGFWREDSASSYRVRSRIASNGENKIGAVCDLVAANPLRNVLVQNWFVETGGIKAVASALEGRLNYAYFVVDADGMVTAGPPDLVGKTFEPMLEDGYEWDTLPEAPSYGTRWMFVLTGETDGRVFEWVKKVVCDPRNRYGAFIHVLLCSSVGNLGLDLKNGGVAIYMSLGFHIEDYNQFIGRYVRYRASMMLPPDMRTVQPYILISVSGQPANEEIDPEREKATTDEHLLSLCMKKLKENAVHADIRWSVSIECLMGVSASPQLCRRCMPNGLPLTTGNFRHDMIMPNPCVELPSEVREMRVVEVVMGDVVKKLGRLDDPLRLYEIVGEDTYRLVNYASPLYGALKD